MRTVFHRAETSSAHDCWKRMEITQLYDYVRCVVTHLYAFATNTINTEYRIHG